MSRTVFRSPTSVPAAAAIVPARLGERYAEALWRDLPGGELEVAIKDGNRQRPDRLNRIEIRTWIADD